MQHGKKYTEAAQKVDRERLYPAEEAVALAKQTSRPPSTPLSRCRCALVSTRARPTRWSAAPSTCRMAPVRPPGPGVRQRAEGRGSPSSWRGLRGLGRADR